MLFLLSDRPLYRTQTQYFQMVMKGRFSGKSELGHKEEEMTGTEMIIVKYQQVNSRWSLHLQVLRIVRSTPDYYHLKWIKKRGHFWPRTDQLFVRIYFQIKPTSPTRPRPRKSYPLNLRPNPKRPVNPVPKSSKEDGSGRDEVTIVR